MVSWVGDDAAGALVLADLQRFGVDTTHVIIEPGTATNFTTVLIDSSGEKAVIIVPTAFNTLKLTPALKKYLSRTACVYISPYDLEQLAQVAALVHRAGGLICTDIEPVANLNTETLLKTLALVDIAFINAAALPDDDLERAVLELSAAGPTVVVATAGARGAVACQAQEVVRCPAFSGPVVDTTGAGDCFAAAFLAGYLHRLPLKQALIYASAAAALSIQALGARGALPTEAQVRAFLTTHRQL